MQNKKSTIADLKKLLDDPSKLPVDKLPVPEGVSQKIIQAVKEPMVDNNLYGYGELADRVLNMPEMPKITTGFAELDELLDGGLQEGELMILSAMSKSGKTSLFQTMAYYQSLKKIPSVWFTLEMGWQEITRKFMLMDDEYQSSGKIVPLPIFYPIDNRGLSLKWLEHQIIRAQKEHKVQIAYIDHLHELVPLADSKSNVSYIVGGLVREIKRLAMVLKIPILLIIHTPKHDIYEIPDMYSSRDTALAVCESDFMITLWREPFKQKKSDDPMQNDNVYTDRTILSLVANRRNGQTKRMALGMINGKFYPYEEYLNIKSEKEGEELTKHMGEKNEVLTKTKQELELGLDEKNTDFYDK